MGYIYKITNDINDKVYVGKSEYSIQKRWKEHLKDSKKRKNEKRPLYNAMNKYGPEHFFIELVEETDNLSEREQFWIDYYDAYYNGYNGTKGGDGSRRLDYDLVISTYKKVQNVAETAKLCNVHYDSVRKILKGNNVAIKSNGEVTQDQSNVRVEMYDKNDHDKLIKKFDSISDAARYIKSIDKQVKAELKHIVSGISKVCKWKTKSAYGYFWRYEVFDDALNVSNQGMMSKHKVAQYSLQGELLKTFDSYKEAAQYLINNGDKGNISSFASVISKAVNGQQKTARGYIWKSVE